MSDAPPSESFPVPDRPDVTNSASTVPRGAAQVELGVDATTHPRQRPADAFDFTTSLRIGLTEAIELRVAEGTPLRRLAPDADPGIAFGLEARVLTTERGTSFGIQPMLAAHPRVLRAMPAPPSIVLTLIGSQELGSRAGLDINVGARVDPLRPRNVAYLASASLGLQLHPRVIAFTEAFVAGERHGAFELVPGCDAGLIVGVLRPLSVDFAVRVADLGEHSEIVAVVGLTLAWLPRSHGERIASPRRGLSLSHRRPVAYRGS